MMKTVAPTLTCDGKVYALPEVLVSDNPDEQGRREENELFAMGVVHEALPDMNRHLYPMRPQEVFLRVVTEVVRAQYGKRDEPAEHETSVRYFRHYGFGLITPL